MSTAVEGTILWEPPAARKQASTLQKYMDWLVVHKQRSFSSYAALWAWSVDDIEGFWESIWGFFELRAATPYTQVLYSSGTTGLPKPIVQGHGGILLEHLKSLALQLDLQAHDRRATRRLRCYSQIASR